MSVSSRFLTAARLELLNAPSWLILTFRRHFGDVAEVTPELCESVASDFWWQWMALHLLSLSAQDDYKQRVAPARAQVERNKTAIMTAYDNACDHAMSKYADARNRALTMTNAEVERAKAAYQDAMDIADDEFGNAQTLSRTEYLRACARTFGELYVSDAGRAP